MVFCHRSPNGLGTGEMGDVEEGLSYRYFPIKLPGWLKRTRQAELEVWGCGMSKYQSWRRIYYPHQRMVRSPQEWDKWISKEPTRQTQEERPGDNSS